ncbi:diguanylate cyclase [Mesorhizobium soli]|uniref:GGDEF domain-containing protein n=1 Tax=Pseudaminobacter soli (ex Li et al. 2025) TaxID=1295366 RepID=UPI0024730626|nr:GGDEF domain-containing protein [Mesorhizobium soli]MDH6235240.1 diguanylate cyclase [Mesorhizobium soli]
MAGREARNQGLWPIFQLVLLGTLGCVGLSLLFNYLLLFSALTSFGRGVVASIALPLLIGVPMLAVIGLKLRELRGLRNELNRSASYDRVTDTYHGDVFSSLVERRMKSRNPKSGLHGALLVVNAEHLNSIIQQHGFVWGNEALRLIAGTIRSSIRHDDFVGRIGTTEFAIFLHHATEQDAVDVGSRIRSEIAKVYFAPEGEKDILTVRVGGVAFDEATDFTAMHRAAEAQMSATNRKTDDVEVTLLRDLTFEESRMV